MRTIWNDPDTTELHLYIKKVGEVYEQYKFTHADRESLEIIRNNVYVGLMDAKALLDLYLRQKGFKIDGVTKRIVPIKIIEEELKASIDDFKKQNMPVYI
jgi:hypothetical protein